MSVGEAAFSYTGKDNKGNLCTIRGESFVDFRDNLLALLGDEAAVDTFLADEFARDLAPTPAQALATVHQVFPGAQPVAAAQAVQQPSPMGPPAGQENCAHGPRQYKSSKTARGMWNRWECAVPWTKGADNSQRCAAVNV